MFNDFDVPLSMPAKSQTTSPTVTTIGKEYIYANITKPKTRSQAEHRARHVIKEICDINWWSAKFQVMNAEGDCC